ncbi:Uncharacterized protein pbN1_35570 [Aromatoleum bremense]|nr:Uncharacterized protein pbN1_35570 [Aromatoleum bremense]
MPDEPASEVWALLPPSIAPLIQKTNNTAERD